MWYFAADCISLFLNCHSLPLMLVSLRCDNSGTVKINRNADLQKWKLVIHIKIMPKTIREKQEAFLVAGRDRKPDSRLVWRIASLFSSKYIRQTSKCIVALLSHFFSERIRALGPWGEVWFERNMGTANAATNNPLLLVALFFQLPISFARLFRNIPKYCRSSWRQDTKCCRMLEIFTINL